ncbi:hypothetical protein QA540_04920 [Macrococcus psychrotolerans]|uniref:Uncharacterized protein n=1 Tax=Macrococcus psychrotolerans TaxID=3039389 RepID=A0AAU6RIE6_9STAP
MRKLQALKIALLIVILAEEIKKAKNPSYEIITNLSRDICGT